LIATASLLVDEDGVSVPPTSTPSISSLVLLNDTPARGQMEK
jgi:hypothetical protein